MPAVKEDQFSGGGKLTPNDSAGKDDLATILRSLIDDNLRANAIASPDATDLASAITLVNEIKTALNVALTTTKG